MDDMYNSQNGQTQPYQQPGQPKPTVQEQLQSSYQHPPYRLSSNISTTRAGMRWKCPSPWGNG